MVLDLGQAPTLWSESREGALYLPMDHPNDYIHICASLRLPSADQRRQIEVRQRLQSSRRGQ